MELVNDRVLSIQYLRGFAAILVAYFHCFANSVATPYVFASTHAFGASTSSSSSADS